MIAKPYVPRTAHLERRALQVLRLGPRRLGRWVRAALARGPVEFPMSVATEITNHCNLACATCPRPAPQDRGYMTLDLFRKVVDECVREPRMRSLIVTGFGEPTLHEDVVAMTRYAREKGIPYVRGFTNARLLGDDVGESILRESGFDELTLSLNAGDAKTYQAFTCSDDYEKVVEGLERFFARRKKLPGAPFVNLQLLTSEAVEHDVDGFVKKWLPLLRRGDCIRLKAAYDFAGQVDSPVVGHPRHSGARRPCGMLWNLAFVFWNGDVAPCCTDPFRKLRIGNVNESSLRELWQSEALHRFRDLHLAGRYEEMPLCPECVAWVYYRKTFPPGHQSPERVCAPGHGARQAGQAGK